MGCVQVGSAEGGRVLPEVKTGCDRNVDAGAPAPCPVPVPLPDNKRPREPWQALTMIKVDFRGKADDLKSWLEAFPCCPGGVILRPCAEFRDGETCVVKK